MPKPTPPYLRLHREELPESLTSVAAQSSKVNEACARFGAATGWNLRIVADAEAPPDDVVWSTRIAPGPGAATMRVELAAPSSAAAVAFDAASTIALAEATAVLIEELARTRHALWQREAELAAGVPVAPHADERGHLAERLEAILRGGAEAVGYEAAALYMLDAATTELKLRSCWGMPKSKLLDEPRDLPTAVADLEALCGNAVVLDDVASLPHWNVPEKYVSAVCVPVSSPTNLLGTVWMFSNESRDLSDEETNIVEIVAGRLAAELEREVILGESTGSVELRRQVDLAAQWQADQLPQIQPLVEGWDVAGWADHERDLGTAFFDWFATRTDRVCCTMGQVAGDDLAAAMAAASLQTSLRAHGGYEHGPISQLEMAHQSVWASSASPRSATLFVAQFDARGHEIDLAATSDVYILLLGSDGRYRALLSAPTPLEPSQADQFDGGLTLVSDVSRLEPGDRLLVVNRDVLLAEDADGRRWGPDGLSGALSTVGDSPSVFLANAVRSQLEQHCGGPPRGNPTLLVIRRQNF
ncbi:MAG: SpoIIE family protein phosphatase [Pirellulales bacterium]